MSQPAVQLKSFRRVGNERVDLVWADGHAGPVSVRTLRDACPCAGCKGETVLLHHYAPQPQDEEAPGKYTLLGASTVGSYAIQLRWGDGHTTGIYTWEHLRSLCECPACRARREGR